MSSITKTTIWRHNLSGTVRGGMSTMGQLSINPVGWAQEQDVIEDIINLAKVYNDEDPEIKVETDCPACMGVGTVKLFRDAKGNPSITCENCKYCFPITQECPECGDVGAMTTELWAAAQA